MNIRRPSQPQKKGCSPNRPSVMEGLDLVYFSIGCRVNRAYNVYFILELGNGTQGYRAKLSNE